MLRAEAASGSERYAFSDIVTDPDETAGLETGHASDGYVVARYLGDKERARVTITGPDGSTTPWPLNKDEETVIALTSGSGPYRAMFYEDTGNFNFAAIFETVFIATLKDPLAPFLASDYYAPYTEDSACVKRLPPRRPPRRKPSPPRRLQPRKPPRRKRSCSKLPPTQHPLWQAPCPPIWSTRPPAARPPAPPPSQSAPRETR